MNKIVLYLPAGGNSKNLIEHVKSNFENIFIIVSDYDEGKKEFCSNADIFLKSPRNDSEEYFFFNEKTINQYNVNVIIPGISADVNFFSKHHQYFSSLGAVATTSSYEANEITIDKNRCYEELKKIGINTPEFYHVSTAKEFEDAAKKLKFPETNICIKPAKYPNGSGKGFRIICSEKEFAEKLFYNLPSEMYYTKYDSVISAMNEIKSFPELLVMEYLPGSEYSVYCLCDAGNCNYIVPNKKLSMIETNTKDAVVEKNEEIENLCRKICKHLNFDYNINIQFKYDKNGVPKLVEINPRLAGTIMLPVKAGVDLISFSILKALGKAYEKNEKIKYGSKIIRDIRDNFYIVQQ